MEPETKLYMQREPIGLFEHAAIRRGAKPDFISVESEADAVRQALDKGVKAIKISERVEVEHDGEILKGEIKNTSPTIYVGFDKILTVEDVIALEKQVQQDYLEQAKNLPQNKLLRNMFEVEADMHTDDALSIRAQALRDYHADTLFIQTEVRKFGNWPIKNGNKVYNSQGQRIFPQPTGGLALEEAPEV